MMRINGRDICPCELLRVSLRSVIVIFLVALSNSCGGSKGNILLTEVREIPVDGEMPLLEGKELDLEILGAKKLSVCGDWMIVNTSNKNAQVSLVNLNTLEEIAGICPEGKAKTDFRYPDFSIRQFVMEDDGHWKMIMKDNWSTIKYIDLTESAAQKRTVIDRYFEEEEDTYHMSDYSTVYIDSIRSFIFNGFDYDDGKECYVAPKFYCVDDTVKTEVVVFGDLNVKDIDYNNYRSYMRLYALTGNLYVSPDRRKFLYACSPTNYLNVIDYENCSAVTFIPEGGITYERALATSPDRSYPDVMYCCDCAVENDFFIVLYVNDDVGENGETASASSCIRVIGWDGSLLGSAKLDQDFGSMAYDRERNRIFCMDPVYETIYSYDLNGILDLRRDSL